MIIAELEPGAEAAKLVLGQSRAATECVLRAVLTLTFPGPEGGFVRVAYPLMFGPG